MKENLPANKFEIEDIYPMTDIEKGLIFDSLLNPEAPAYYGQSVYPLTDTEFDPQRLKKTLILLAEKHPILRTGFNMYDFEEPIHIVYKEIPPDMEHYDISHLEITQQKEYIDRFMAEDRKKGLGIEKSQPLWKMRSFAGGNGLIYILWICHHAIIDGWSTASLFTEFFNTYNRLKTEPGLTLEPLKSTYKEFVIQQMIEKTKKETIDFWKNELTGYKKQDFSGILGRAGNDGKVKHYNYSFDSPLLQSLKDRARQYKTTLKNLCFGAYVYMLGTVTGDDDIITGMGINNRPLCEDGDKIIGCFLNLAPVRLKIDRQASWQEYIQAVESKLLQLKKYERLSLFEIISLLKEKNFSRNPLFDTAFNFVDFHVFKKLDRDHQRAPVPNPANTSDTPASPQTAQGYGFSNVPFGFVIDVSFEGFALGIEYLDSVFNADMIAGMCQTFEKVLHKFIYEPGTAIGENPFNSEGAFSAVSAVPGTSPLTGAEKKQLLIEFNDTGVGPLPAKTIPGLFAEKVQEIPDQTALSFYFDLAPIYDALRDGKMDTIAPEALENGCFRKNPFIFQFRDPSLIKLLNIKSEIPQNEWFMLRTHRWNYAAVNKPVLLLLDYCDGKINVKSLRKALNPETPYIIYTFTKDEYTDFSGPRRYVFTLGQTGLFQVLTASYLLELAGWSPAEISVAARDLRDIDCGHRDISQKEGPGSVAGVKVLLLGDRVGQASTGLLYIASFLRRNGIGAYCCWNNMSADLPSLKKHIETLMAEIRPRVVGVSMKWFPHIARVLEICKIVKSYDPLVKVVVGGNTAAYFKEDVIGYECIDYVVKGDGELPFLKICRGDDGDGETEIPNCLYKRDGKIIETPVTYVQDGHNSADIYLSHLDQIFVNAKDPFLAPYFYINTGKGCAMQCLYCAGCRDTQQKIFNRSKPFLRGVDEVRRDMVEVMKYTSTYWFDFDLPFGDTLDYYKKIWSGLDLSPYFCEFYFWKLPDPEFIDETVKTFKYVYFNIDLCSLSEAHRLKLAAAGLVKPQPTDEELFAFFDHCEKYNNIEVIINQVSGLPWFTYEDIQVSHRTLSRLQEKYSTLGEIDWGRLHAQPGAPITQNYTDYNMHCYAANFAEFLHFSGLNLQEKTYPTLENFHYPYIYYQDDRLNSKISQFYAESNREMQKYSAEKAKRKQRPAVLTLTYRELNEQADRLAGVLIEKGVKPGVIAAVMMERCPEMIIAVLAILKAGGAYLPLDPKHPQERIDYMLKDSNAAILINKSGVNVINRINGCSRRGFSDFHPSNLAYIIYTSGTTGKPKGVMVDHQNVVRLVRETNYIDFKSGDKLLMTGSLVFDITTFEIWGSLLNGLNLFLTDNDTILDIEKMAALVMGQGITILHLIPQLFNQAFSQFPRLFGGLRYFMVGGDLVRPLYVNRLHQMYPQLKILHMYGPTENTTFSTFFLIAGEYESRIPIGKPIGHSTVYILDEASSLVPVGTAGELCVGGLGVARGYLNKPGLTAERFYRSYRDNKTYILYKTGDLARWLPDGNIEFLGRKDNQVKIRGIRVEPGEIENRLLEHEYIEEAVVISGETGNEEEKEAHLAAYFVAARPIPEPHIELRKFLAEALPEAMIPTYFIPIDRVPLTPNGKIDRKALPAPTAAGELSVNVDLNTVSRLMKEGIDDGPTLENLLASFSLHWQNNIFKQKIKLESVAVIPGRDESSLPVLQLFMGQVQAHPQQIAAIEGSVKMTYRELDETANRLAQVLLQKGLKPGNCVGLMVERSLAGITGILGILKAGGEVLELGPELKSREAAALLTQNRASLLLTSASAVEKHAFTVLQGLTFNEEFVIKTPPRPQVMDFDALPLPNRSLVDYAKYNRYLDEATMTHTLSIQATRGCPYHCLYCHKIWPKRHVVRSAENIFAEIKLYYDMGVRRFSFIDDIFNLDVKNSSKVYELIIKHGMKPQLLFPSGVRGDILTGEYIDLMVEAGATNVVMALETASPRLQKMLKKNINLEKLNENLNYFCRHHPQVLLGLFTMHGFPTETEAEALLTLDFIKNLKWLHFPYINVLKIFPHTDMETLALENGVSREAIERSADLTYHDLPDTLPFDKKFSSQYQAQFVNDYVLSKERLLQVLPYQMKVLTADEFLMAYRSIFNIDAGNFAEFLELVGIGKEELPVDRFLDESSIAAPEINTKMRAHFSPHVASPGALRILLLDLSQFFTGKNDLFNELVEAPLGLMYLLTTLYQELGAAVTGKIAKSMIDFDNFDQLKTIINDFQPGVIGIRALTLHQNFLHEAVAFIRQWGFTDTIICGGPYATSGYATLLQDKNIDLAVIGEGEITFVELIREIIKNQGRLPGPEVLHKIQGLAFNPPRMDVEDITTTIIFLDTYGKLPQEDPVEYCPHEFELGANFIFGPIMPGLAETFHQGKPVVIVPREISRRGIRRLDFYPNIRGENSDEIPTHIDMVVEQAWQKELSAAKTNYLEPRSDLEKKIAGIWQAILKIERVGLDDNFFELGGHSLNATILLAKLRKVFDVDLPLSEIFKSPTVRGLAEWVKSAGSNQYIAIEPLEKKEYYPLSYNQKRLWLINQLSPEELPYNLWNLIKLNHAVDAAVLRKAIDRLVEHHEALRTGFKEVGGEPVQYVADQVTIPFQVHDLSVLDEFEKRAQRAQIIKRETKILFDLTRAPLFKTTLIQLTETQYEFIYNMHHIISDGWSLEILGRQFMRLYEDSRNGKDLGGSLETLPVQYKDFAAWGLEKLKKAETKEKSHRFWRPKLEAGIPTFALPEDFEGKKGEREGAGYWFAIEKEIKDSLKRLAEKQNTTLFMVLFAAYNILMARFSGRKDVLCAIINAGRDHELLHNVVGYFINPIPIISHVDDDENFSDFLQRVKNDILEAFECQAYPFELVLEDLKMKYPNLPVALNMGNISDGEAGEITSFEPYHIPESPAYFDIVSYLSEFKNGITMTMCYNKSMLKPTTIEAVAGAFKKLLKYIATMEGLHG